MTCDDYLEHLWNTYTFHTLISEQYWSGGVNTLELWEYMQRQALKDCVQLEDLETWDYDKHLYVCYQNSDDKGLS